MASEYIKYMVGDGKPQEPSPELTPKEKWKNWWHYNWWIVAVVLAAVVAVGSLVLKNLGVTEPLADYNVAYVGSRPLSDETVEAVVATFQEFGEDASGDGVVTVAVNQYVIYENSADVESLQMNSATKALLESDIVARTSWRTRTANCRRRGIMAGRTRFVCCRTSWTAWRKKTRACILAGGGFTRSRR